MNKFEYLEAQIRIDNDYFDNLIASLYDEISEKCIQEKVYELQIAIRIYIDLVIKQNHLSALQLEEHIISSVNEEFDLNQQSLKPEIMHPAIFSVPNEEMIIETEIKQSMKPKVFMELEDPIFSEEEKQSLEMYGKAIFDVKWYYEDMSFNRRKYNQYISYQDLEEFSDCIFETEYLNLSYNLLGKKEEIQILMRPFDQQTQNSQDKSSLYLKRIWFIDWPSKNEYSYKLDHKIDQLIQEKFCKNQAKMEFSYQQIRNFKMNNQQGDQVIKFEQVDDDLTALIIKKEDKSKAKCGFRCYLQDSNEKRYRLQCIVKQKKWDYIHAFFEAKQLAVDDWNIQLTILEIDLIPENISKYLENSFVHLINSQTPTRMKKIKLNMMKYRLMKFNDIVKFLFHGTSKTEPSMIFQGEDGFDNRFSGNDNYGFGSYFSQNSQISHQYAYTKGDKEYQIFVALVIVGETLKCSQKMKDLRLPPLKPNSNIDRYDSIYDNTLSNYIVYDNNKSYPGYLITYRLP
ncbi:UNKNOWN [Stylonychia lemnae]|uniref:Poly [ADP-ribose] polymerase n=1 Tax=Stylonychia lemnae TaxID=5949 RepID=A0A078ADZ4_STYLE|nr:UNKNOWN [Stylonychia lemnae]|eukprot:CDW80444.1 UNKNOWN [Stylonychia lemnae]